MQWEHICLLAIHPQMDSSVTTTALPLNGKVKLALKMSEILLMPKSMKKMHSISVLEWRNNLTENPVQSASVV